MFKNKNIYSEENKIINEVQIDSDIASPVITTYQHFNLLKINNK